MKRMGYLLLGLAFSWPVQAAVVVAKQDGAAILAQAKRGSAVLKELKPGESIEAADRTGMFWAVKLPDGKPGFVFVLQVERKVEEAGGIQSELRKSALAARSSAESGSSARARSSVMGVRGLDESQDLSQAGNLRPDYRSVYSMEDRIVAETRVIQLGRDIQDEIDQTLNRRKKN